MVNNSYFGTSDDPVTQLSSVPWHFKQELTFASLAGIAEAMNRKTTGNICILIVFYT